MARTYEFTNPRLARVLDLIRTHDGITAREISNITTIDEAMVRLIVTNFATNGLIHQRGVQVVGAETRPLWHATDFEPERGVL